MLRHAESDFLSVAHFFRKHLARLGISLLTMTLAPYGIGSVLNGGQATITVNVADVSADISPLIYGQFIEHLGRAIYGGIYDAKSPLSDTNGFRKDVLQQIRGLGAPLMRYPGGTVTKIYHWKDGIGPKAQRPVRRNLIWGGEDNNYFGTDEFMAYCRVINAEPFLTVNMSTGTAEEASDWVEYCNGAGESYYAALRRKNGQAAPYGVRYWGLGNEEAAQEDVGVLQNPDDYVKKAWYYAKLMKLQDPGIELIIVGADEHWNKTVLESLHPICDYISLHLYASSEAEAPYSLFKSVAKMEEKVISMAAQIKALTPREPTPLSKWYRFPGRKGPIKIAVDEWGIWEGGGHGAYGLELTYNWNHALGVASFLNMLQRHADVVGMATWAQTVNVLAPIMTDEKVAIAQTIYYPMALYRQLCGSRSVRTTVDCGTLLDTDQLPVLDVSSSLDDAGKRLAIAVVNRSATDQIDLRLNVESAKIGGSWTVHELTAASVDRANTIGEPEKNVVDHRVTSLPANANHFSIGAHTIAILQVDLAK
jgi:alpha-N-arabinofuranosidase